MRQAGSMILEKLLLLKSYLVFAWLASLFVWERVAPASGSTWWPHNRQSVQRLGRNTGLWLLNAAVSLLLVLPITLWAADHALPWRPDWWQGGWGLAADLLLLDLWIYWWHRVNHEVTFLWRFHRVHHLDQHLDVTSALRFHFGEVILSALVRVAVIILLGVPFASVVLFESLVLVCAIFHHSDIRLNPVFERILSKLVITPAIHWVHHHAVYRDTNSNYGTVLSYWDRLFGSRSRFVRTAAMPIGLENQVERPFARLLIAPFGKVDNAHKTTD